MSDSTPSTNATLHYAKPDAVVSNKLFGTEEQIPVVVVIKDQDGSTIRLPHLINIQKEGEVIVTRISDENHNKNVKEQHIDAAKELFDKCFVGKSIEYKNDAKIEGIFGSSAYLLDPGPEIPAGQTPTLEGYNALVAQAKNPAHGGTKVVSTVVGGAFIFSALSDIFGGEGLGIKVMALVKAIVGVGLELLAFHAPTAKAVQDFIAPAPKEGDLGLVDKARQTMSNILFADTQAPVASK